MNLHYSSRGNSAGQVVNAGLIALANRELFRKAEKLEAAPSRTGLLAGMTKRREKEAARPIGGPLGPTAVFLCMEQLARQ